MRLVTEATFARQVLRAELPVLVCFGTRACQARRVMLPALEGVAAKHSGGLLVVTVLLDGAQLLAEQYGVGASPTLMVFQHGERQGQVIGFLPDGLLHLLADEVARGTVKGDSFWSPVEERFEDAVLIPLLRRWGLTFQRQAPCAIAGGERQQRGRIDLLVYENPLARPITLIESKRQIRGSQELQQAVAQAAAYARGLALPSFVVAAPRGLWIYRHSGGRSVCARQLTSLEVQQAPQAPLALLLQLGSGASPA